MNWILEYMQKPFEHDSYGPDSFDCYGLLWHVCKHQGGIELPRMDNMEGHLARINAAVQGQILSGDWREVWRPQQFDAVVMRRAGEAYHVGVWLDVDGGKVLHATPAGVLCNDRGGLKRMNFQHVQYYRYADH